LTGDRRQNAIDEATRVIGRKGLCQLHRFVKDDGNGWFFSGEQLTGGELQDETVYHCHALNRPANGCIADEAKRLLAEFFNLGKELTGKRVRSNGKLIEDRERREALCVCFVEEA